MSVGQGAAAWCTHEYGAAAAMPTGSTAFDRTYLHMLSILAQVSEGAPEMLLNNNGNAVTPGFGGGLAEFGACSSGAASSGGFSFGASTPAFGMSH